MGGSDSVIATCPVSDQRQQGVNGSAFSMRSPLVACVKRVAAPQSLYHLLSPALRYSSNSRELRFSVC